MYTNPYHNANPYSPVQDPSVPKPVYSARDSAFAWLSILFGYLFCRVVPVTARPLGTSLLILGLFITAYAILGLSKVKIPFLYILSSISALSMAAVPLVTDSALLENLAFMYAMAGYCYFIYAALGNTLEKGFSNYAPVDFIKAVFVIPFRSCKALFPAIGSSMSKKGGKVVLKVLAGFLIAIVPTVTILGFLSYDKGFTDLLDKLSWKDFEPASHLGSLILAIPLAMYGFGLYISAGRKPAADSFTADNCRRMAGKVRIMPQITAVAAVLPVLFLYVVFFISQWQYYVSGFTGVLPENFSYAQYAREGFFQLCSVSVINLLIILAIVLVMKRKENGKAPLLKLLCVVFCLCTLVLISTAVAKLIMYIEIYGLTQKRVFAMWLMAVIAIVYIIIALGQFLPKIRPAAASMAVCIVMFTALSLCNVNTQIAQYNVDRYLDGTLESVDVDALTELGDSAVPAMVQLLQAIDDDPEEQMLYQEIYDTLERKAKRIRLGFTDESIFAFDIPHHKAKQALLSYGFVLEEPQEETP